MIILFLASLLPFAVAGCSEDTELRWSNGSGTAVNTIQWMNGGTANQTWNDTADLANGQTNDFKKVTKLVGEGQCDSGGTVYDIQVNGTTDTFAQLTDGNSQTLSITGLATKK